MIALTFATTVHIGVLGSFHPVQLEVRPAEHTTLVMETAGRSEVIHTPEVARLDYSSLEAPAHIAGPKGSFARFTIRLPNGVEREYYGRLDVSRHLYELQPVVEMDRELAVASVLAAEGANAMPRQALQAQAIAVRSYMLGARGRHEGFDVCDTTHCQRLESPPGPNSVVAKAARDTRGLVLTYEGKIVPALYSANCGGHTKAFGWENVAPGDYPFTPVECPRRGPASGHGVGLCQLGAMDMANAGAHAEEILAHYFPGTQMESLAGDTVVTLASWHRGRRGAKHSLQTLGGPRASNRVSEAGGS